MGHRDLRGKGAVCMCAFESLGNHRWSKGDVLPSLFYWIACERSEPWFLMMGNPDVFGLQLPKILASTAAGKGIW